MCPPGQSVGRSGWLVGRLVMTTHMAATVSVRPATHLKRALLSLPLFFVVVFAGALFRHANYALWSCSRIEETRNEMHEEERRERGEFNIGGGTKERRKEGRVNISVEQKSERTKGMRQGKQTNAKPRLSVCLSVSLAGCCKLCATQNTRGAIPLPFGKQEPLQIRLVDAAGEERERQRSGGCICL